MKILNQSTTENDTAVFQKNQNNKADDFDKRISAIWDKVGLLEGIKYIENEREKFIVAYRFIEIELEKVCQEKDSLEKSFNDVFRSYSR